MLSRNLLLLLVACCLGVFRFGAGLAAEEIPGNAKQALVTNDDELVMVIMDPLAAPLACDCVKGYAQRKYEALGKYLTTELGKPVKVYWGGALKSALKESNGRADIIIGKYSVVQHDAAAANRRFTPLASLTGMDGSTTQTGLVVVRAKDRAKSVSDLKGYRIFFGTPDAEEKSAAVMKLLRKSGIELPTEPETCEACSTAATNLLELEDSEDGAAVISSYARPLLEGCGTIQKGDLRVIGESAPVPFVTAFASEELPLETRQQIENALLAVSRNKELMGDLETRNGFVPLSQKPAGAESLPAAGGALETAGGLSKKKN
jgi:ABC-type phosphate/phosphonate transport system substrate-binding protein